MPDHLNFFGIPEENLEAARRHQTTARKPANFSVPSRKEIASLPPDDLKAKLIAWMESSTIEIIPSRGQIALVRDALAERPDAAALQGLIAMCTHYMDGA